METSATLPDNPTFNVLNIPTSDQPRLVIVGGGFGGLQLAKSLRGRGYQVVMLDRNNYHTFQPLLYQVATAGLEPDSIAGPLRRMMQSTKDFFFRLANVLQINAEERILETSLGQLRYDYLVIATGSRTNYFGQEKNFGKAFPLKQVPQALDLRSHLLQNFERSVVSSDLNERKQLMNFVIVGGGPTGVEVAGALGELKNHVLPQDYPDLDFRQMNIYLVEGNTRVLAGMSEKSGEKALRYLKRFSVNVLLERTVQSFDGHQVVMSDGTEIPCQTVVWAAGVRGNIFDGIPEESIDRGRLKVDEYNKVQGLERVYAIGDVAKMESEGFPNGHPMLAPVAIQQGTLLAGYLKREKKGKTWKSFTYKDKGSMATIGRHRAVVDIGNIRIGGTLGWYIWMFVHLWSIIGFRNKLVVFWNWVWNYFTDDRGTRLIIRPYTPRDHSKEG